MGINAQAAPYSRGQSTSIIPHAGRPTPLAGVVNLPGRYPSLGVIDSAISVNEHIAEADYFAMVADPLGHRRVDFTKLR